ncbi:uncharacterized protein BJ171DRAFT_520423 [Polychytrium aggregatum]|uniref:uncharacterized protein n=1 Tax=Polychytrium aggregatum TaxID=110093 RepID=UPI0022FEE058|nr:uncharacterized protein BJ171DRAFT_520423 [Polychytrium aggregatum]KAI9197275.1 hypothetical protein BJ171DRAFT_520423 [Polychytrium aggregatum]
MDPASPSIKNRSAPSSGLSSVLAPTVAVEELFENQRGFYLAGKPKFTKKALLPTDFPPWSDAAGKFRPGMNKLACPPRWEWVSEWTVDATGDVDAKGWSYGPHFKSLRWKGQCGYSHYVRRRRWIRKRHLPIQRPHSIIRSGWDPSPAIKVQRSTGSLIDMALQLDDNRIDSERLNTLESWTRESGLNSALSENLTQVLRHFEFDHYRLKAAMILCKALPPSKLDECIGPILETLQFFSSRVELLKALGLDLALLTRPLDDQ